MQRQAKAKQYGTAQAILLGSAKSIEILGIVLLD